MVSHSYRSHSGTRVVNLHTRERPLGPRTEGFFSVVRRFDPWAVRLSELGRATRR
jgi:hypothetical protein